MRVTMLLADAAQEVGGKLYILGGGWNVMNLPVGPSAVAIHIHVPWDQSNRRQEWRLELLDSDGGPVLVQGPVEEKPLAIEGNYEVGRPPGVPHGSDLGVSIAINVSQLPLQAGGRYVWQLSIDGQTEADWRLPFSVAPASPAAQPPLQR